MSRPRLRFRENRRRSAASSPMPPERLARLRLFLRSLPFFLAASIYGTPNPLAAIRHDLQYLAIDKTHTWRVRDLEVSNGGVNIYLSEGVLAFATPVDGHRVAAVFTTAFAEAGDAELVAYPPSSVERASLARFIHTPALDEHFTSALFFFADDTAEQLLKQILEHPLHAAPELAPDIGSRFENTLRRNAAEIDVRIAQSILDRHIPGNSFFYGMIAGRTVGPFDFVFQPDQPDPVVIGRVVTSRENRSSFQIWAAYRPKSMSEASPIYRLSDYHIETTIRPDLSMASVADFDYQVDSADGTVISLFLTPKLHVSSATIDGEAASVLQHYSPRSTETQDALSFLVVSGSELVPGTRHRVKVQYEGSVVRRTTNGTYFVEDRNAWYPFVTPMLTVFDLKFHTPENLRIVSTGELVSEEDVANGQLTVHRRTAKAQLMAGFNLGEYNVTISESSRYRIEICANPQVTPSPDLAEQAGRILQYFSTRWMPLYTHSLAVTPIDGYFGQGFPGLIYLSSVSYLREPDRPLGLRNPTFDAFFSQLLLPHELAHEWWGNIVMPRDYRENWIIEAMANYSALEYLEEAQGTAVADAILVSYRSDLTKVRQEGELVDSYGPVTFDERLEANFGKTIWHHILYEKGTWIMHMLGERMGPSAFHRFQLRLLTDFSDRPISNEDLREAAARFIPADQPDPKLTAFFDTWVYDTGIPTLTIKGGNLLVSGVPASYVVDVPLQCGRSKPTWLRAVQGETPLPAPHCTLPLNSEFLFKN